MYVMHFQANKLGYSGLITGHSSCSTLGDPSKGKVLKFILFLCHVMNSLNVWFKVVFEWTSSKSKHFCGFLTVD